jgi:hypothetical protein
MLEVEVVWQSTQPLPTTPALVSLTVTQPGDGRDEKISLAQAAGQLTALASDLIVSRHRLLLPADLSRGSYTLEVDGQPLGEIELRHFQVLPQVNRVEELVFGQQIALAGYQFEPAADYLGVTIAWQAQISQLPDYTVFVQILTAETGERLAGVDTPPLKGEWPTSRWVKGEVVVDEYLVAIPPDFPPGFYQVIVGLYQPETGQRLTLADGQDHWTLPWTRNRTTGKASCGFTPLVLPLASVGLVVVCFAGALPARPQPPPARPGPFSDPRRVFMD